MPEGDTVWRTARRLHDVLANQVLVTSDFRVPAYSTVDLTGSRVREVVARGKHLLLRTEPGLTVHTHLKMDGSWQLYRVGSRWRGPGFEVRLVLASTDWVCVGFRLSIVEVVPTAREESVVGHLGPDLLGPDWDLDEAVRRLTRAGERPVGNALLEELNLAGASTESGTKIPTTRSIGEALLDQRCLAGLGTVYMSEVLFLSGVSPLTPVPDVPDLRKVVHLAHRLLMFNKNHPIQVTTGNTTRGQEHYVYLRTGEPCRRCATPIVTNLVGPPTRERRTYWCPSCQP